MQCRASLKFRCVCPGGLLEQVDLYFRKSKRAAEKNAHWRLLRIGNADLQGEIVSLKRYGNINDLPTTAARRLNIPFNGSMRRTFFIHPAAIHACCVESHGYFSIFINCDTATLAI